jgi:tRNA A-37 threonylcarbamoyl transferase component Bud32
MRDPLADVPDAYVVHRVADAWLVLDRKRVDALVPLRLGDPREREALFARAPRRGRGAAPSVPLQGGGSVVLRRYRHGGLTGAVAGALFLGPRRALAELRVNARAEQAGAPVPHVLCLAAWPVLGPLWSALIGTAEEPNATSLLELLGVAPPPRERALRARVTGAALRRLHDAGVEHRDLQLGNVLWSRTDDGDRVVVIDLDRARFRGPGRLDDAARARGLARLARSGVKARHFGAPLGRRELAALVAGYCGRDRSLRARLRAHAPALARRLWLHRVSYAFRHAPSARNEGAPPERRP